MEKIGERILSAQAICMVTSSTSNLTFLDQAAEMVLSMVKDLRHGTDLESARDKNSRLQAIEGDADKLELDLLTEFITANYEARQLMFLRDLYELLEKVIDRCRDAGNVILQIVLKYS